MRYTFFKYLHVCLLAIYVVIVWGLYRWHNQETSKEEFLRRIALPYDPLKISRQKTSRVQENYTFTKNLYRPIDLTTFSHRDQNNRNMVWPDQAKGDDRIEAQLNLKPDSLRATNDKNISVKTIMLTNSLSSFDLLPERLTFEEHNCPISTCRLTDTPEEFSSADAVIFHHSFPPKYMNPRINLNQIWILFLLESPANTADFSGFWRNVFNWTATYRVNSDLVTPYEKFSLFNKNIRALNTSHNYAKHKTRKIAWFVSNCYNTDNERLSYALTLQQFIAVDIYGKCGPHKCSKKRPSCFQILDLHYKFYLAFENSNCKDYITEKFFMNGLNHDVVPIVMGAAPEDYERAAPYHSYIHVDDFDSPKELADYLHKLDQNDTLYNEYFQWKGTGEFINTFFWCRVCAMLHDPQPPRYYDDINAWWRGPGICTNGKWPRRNVKKG